MELDKVLTSLGVTAIAGAAATYFFARLKDTRDRLARVEDDLFKGRDSAYGEIWKLTGALNVFGPANQVNCATLSEQFTNWYFSKGQMLTEDAKSRYFLVQEVLNFYCLRNIVPTRPSDELLFSGKKRTIAALRDRRYERLKIPVRGNEGIYALDELESYLGRFKERLSGSKEEVSEDAWLLLQFVMSAFRSEATKELGTRAVAGSRQRGKRAGA